MHPGFNLTRLNELAKKTIEAIDTSKNELHFISNEFRIYCAKLEAEHNTLKQKVSQLSHEIITIEKKISEFLNFEEILESGQKSEIYEAASELRNRLILKRNEEKSLIKRRNNLELRLKETINSLNKAQTASENINITLDILNDDLKRMSKQIEDIKAGQQIGIKIIKAQEDERRRVAMEMHDGPAQALSNILIHSEICDRLMDLEPQNAPNEIKKLQTNISESLNEIKRIVYDLRPSSLDESGLCETLKKHINTFSEETGISSELNISSFDDNANQKLDSNVSLTIFRIVQESLNNIKKHSGAAFFKVNLSISQTCIELLIYDNGKGFDMQSLLTGTYNLDRGFGLIGIKERVKLLEGTVDIHSFPGEGFKLKIQIPYDFNWHFEKGV